MEGAVNSHGEETTVKVKMPLTHWVVVIGMLLSMGGAWIHVQAGIAELRKVVEASQTSIDNAERGRQLLSEQHRKILDDLTRIADRLSIKQERSELDLRDIEQRVRVIERGHKS